MSIGPSRVLCAIFKGTTIKKSDANSIIKDSLKLLAKESSLMQLSGEVQVIGDLHGSIDDFVKILCCKGIPPSVNYLFLGNYINKGPCSVEVLLGVLSLKLLFPGNVHLLRGNHESDEMAEMFGFMDECKRKLSASIYESFVKLFDCLPLAAVINNSHFCVHGGLSPHLTSPGQIANISRPIRVPNKGLVADLLWSDPSVDVDDWAPSSRGSTFLWGQRAVSQFLSENNFASLIRAHELVYEGTEKPLDNVITVFSSSNYEKKFGNKAGVVSVSADRIETGVLPDEFPETEELIKRFTLSKGPRASRT